MPKKPVLLILDANALLHRAWHALPPLTAPDGMVVNAAYGVFSVVLKLLKEQAPEAFVACWDTEAPTFRHEAYKEYKAQREEQPDELYAQLPLVKEGLALMGVPSLEKDGFEADDLIGTIAVRAKKKGWSCVIITSDRDAFQLIQPDVSVLTFKKGVSETVLFDEAELMRQYQLTPEQFLEYKAMRGDPSDNIPGIKGIGEKGATELLKKFGTLKGIVRAAHDEASDMSPSTRQKLLSAEHELPAILRLVTIEKDVPITFEPEKGSARVQDEPKLRSFFLTWGFATFARRFGGEVVEEKEKKPAQKKGRSTKSTNASSASVGTSTEALAVLDGVMEGDPVVIHVAQGMVGSLFGSKVEGVACATKKGTWLFPSSLLETKEVHARFQKLLLDEGVSRAAHDGKKQMVGLEELGFGAGAWSFDTFLAAYVLGAGERNHDLPSIAQRYADIALPVGASALAEAEAALKLLPILKKALNEEGLSSVLERFDLPLIPVLRDMERAGILIDKPYLAKLAEEMRGDKQALEKKMMKAAGREFNPASPSQLAEILFEELKLPTKGVKRGKTGYSTAAPELEKLRGSHPLIEMIEEHRELAKLLSTYVEVLPSLADKGSRVHTTFNQAVAATGRLSSTDPNVQNIPIRTELGRRIRRAFVAPKGFVLLSCDYSQIELRLVAALANDEEMLAAFRRGEDIHTATAAAIWGIEKDEVTKDQRRISKAINFGLIFGQGPQGLSVAAGIPFADAKKFIATYFEVYRGVKNYMEETKALAHKLGYVETLFGRRRSLPEIHSTMHQVRAQAERMAINMPVQGTDADLMKLAMIELHKTLPGISKESRVLLQVHDELLLEVPEGELKKVAAFAKATMEQVEKLAVPIVVETKAGKNWEEMEPVLR
jgi:DNA polymerase-1